MRLTCKPGQRGGERGHRRGAGVQVRGRQHLERVLQPGGQRDERQQRGVRLGEPGHQHGVVIGHVEVAEDAVALGPVVVGLVRRTFADHAEPVGIIDVEQGVVLLGQARELGELRRVAGHRVDAVHRDQARERGIAGTQQLLEVFEVVVAEPANGGAVAGRDHGPVVDRLVCAAVQEDRAVADEHRDHRHVDVGDRRQHERVLGSHELGELLLDLGVEDGVAQQSRPRGVRAPLRQVLGHRRDDLFVEVEPEVVARGPVGQPAVADPDLASHLFIDDRIHHRVGRGEPGQVGGRRHPPVEPAVVVPPTRLAVRRGFGGPVGDPAVQAVAVPTPREIVWVECHGSLCIG